MNLYEGIRAEINRVDDLIKICDDPELPHLLGRGGLEGMRVAVGLMRHDVSVAEKAVDSGDVAQMVIALQSLRGWE